MKLVELMKLTKEATVINVFSNCRKSMLVDEMTIHELFEDEQMMYTIGDSEVLSIEVAFSYINMHEMLCVTI